MTQTKNPLQSWGIVAPLAMLIVFFANQRWPGLGITDAEASGVIDAIDVALGGALAIWGRWKATKQVTLTGS